MNRDRAGRQRLTRVLVACLALWGYQVGPASGQDGGSGAVRENRVLEQAERLERAGRGAEAQLALENLLEDQPVSVSALLMLAQMSERSGEPERVLPWAEKAVRLDDSGLPGVRQVWIRSLSSAGLQDSALSVAGRWVREEPLEQAAYVELSGLWARAGDGGIAVRVLEEGRSAIGSNRLFVQELAALKAGLGSYGPAAVEWRAMLTWGEAGVDAVERRINDPATRRDDAVAALEEELRAADVTFLERRGALHLALLLGERAWARELVKSLMNDLPEPSRAEVLRDYVTRARESGDLAGAAWGAGSLARSARSAEDARYWRAMAADLYYEAGDYEKAREDFTRLLEESMPGSDVYGFSLRRLHGLVVADDPETAEALLTEHRDRYPEDQLATVRLGVETARAWMDSGALARARSVLEGIHPADVEQAALRAGAYGRLEVLDGRPGAARGHLQLAAAVPTGRPEGRIEAIELLALVDGSDSSSMAALGEGVVVATAVGDPGPLLESVGAWAHAGSEGGAGLAAFAAAELDVANLDQAARSVRIELVQAWPRGPQAPGALLELARSERRENPGQAAEWLELLIVEYPESAMAPVARRVLAELRGGVPGE